MSTYTRTPRRTWRQAGFTLVELMVAVALGMLIMVALVAVYLNVSRTNSEMYKTNGLIENGRFAMDVLNEDLSHGGFWGGYVPQFDNFSLRTTPGDAPDPVPLALGPCAAYALWTPSYRNMLIGAPVEVYGDAPPTGCDTITLIKDRKADTDVLVVRHADTCVPGATNCEALNAAKVYFQNSQCATEIAANNFFRLSNVPGDFTLKGRSCNVAALQPLRKFVSSIYYVRTWASTEGDGIPTLVRSSFGLDSGLPAHEPAQALIEGIESFRAELGIDQMTRPVCGAGPNTTNYASPITSGAAGNLVDPATCTYNAVTLTSNTLPRIRGDGVPESYVRCPALGCTAAQLRDVVAVKVFVLARSREATPKHVDTKTYRLGTAATYTPAGAEQGFKRHLFQTTVRLANISARRETP